MLLDRLRRKETEREKLEHNTNSLKEELKIVYYHTAKLEEALKSEQDNHKITNTKLATQSGDFKANLTKLKNLYVDKLQAKDHEIKSYTTENEDLKNRQKLAEEQYAILTKEHKRVAIDVRAEYDKLKKKKEEESLSLQSQIQDIYNQKVFFQKKSLTFEEDYKKTLKKLIRCKSVLSHRNSSRVTHAPYLTEQKRRKSVDIQDVKAVVATTLKDISSHDLRHLPVSRPRELTYKNELLDSPVKIGIPPQNIDIGKDGKLNPEADMVNSFHINTHNKEIANDIDSDSKLYKQQPNENAPVSKAKRVERDDKSVEKMGVITDNT